MSEYIKREDALEKRQWIPNYGMMVEAVSIDDITAIPAADVEPVVRCKDCIESGSNMKRSTFCYLFDKEMDMDFYCANGKEKNA